MKLYLDGVKFLEEVVSLQSKSNYAIVREGWSRLSMPIQVALTWINTVGLQAIRGTTTILAGVFTLSGRKIVDGLKDYLSLLIQAVALPLIGIVATFHPKTGLRLLTRLIRYQQIYQEPKSASTYVRIVESFFRGMGGVPYTIIDGSTQSLSHILQGKVKKEVDDISEILLGPLYFFILGFVGVCNDEAYKGVHDFLHIIKGEKSHVPSNEEPVFGKLET